MKWRVVVITFVIVISLWLLVLPTTGVMADTTGVVTVVMEPQISGGISGFTITYVTDTDVNLSWALFGDAVNIMVRAKYGAYPSNILDPFTPPSDGYLVYYGNGTTVDDTSMDFDQNAGPLYYTAWAQKADGTWFTDTGSGWKESKELKEIALLAIVLGFTLLALFTRWRILLFIAGIIIMYYAWYFNTGNLITTNYKLGLSIAIGLFGFFTLVYGFLATPRGSEK